MYKKIIIALGFIFLSLQLSAIDRVYTSFFSDLAISGYDPVAYFTAGRPIEGKTEFETEYNGVTWRFSSKKNLLTFKKNPRRYAPQYGGYCGWRMAQDGEPVSTEPEYWDIVNGKLYLSYSADIYAKWKKNTHGFIIRANEFWKKKHGFKRLN